MRAKVTQIENQKVEKEREVTGTEAEQLLKKYGYSNKSNTINKTADNNTNNLSFEEMVKQQEEENKRKQEILKQKRYGAKPITFNSNNGYYSETKYSSDENTGFGFSINITSDMNIPD